MKMKRNQRSNPPRAFRAELGIFFILAILPTSSLRAEKMVALAGHVPTQVLATAANLGSVPADELVHLSFVIHIDQALLDDALDKLYGKNAPATKHFLSSSEFAQQFDLAGKRQILKNFALANGLTIDPNDQPESLAVKISGRRAPSKTRSMCI